MITNSDAESSLTLAATNHEIRKIVKKNNNKKSHQFWSSELASWMGQL